MHIPEYFEIKDREVLERFIKANGFATIVSVDSQYPVATHKPIELEETLLRFHYSSLALPRKPTIII